MATDISMLEVIQSSRLRGRVILSNASCCCDRFLDEFPIAFLKDFGPNDDSYFAPFGILFPYMFDPVSQDVFSNVPFPFLFWSPFVSFDCFGYLDDSILELEIFLSPHESVKHLQNNRKNPRPNNSTSAGPRMEPCRRHFD